MWILREEQHPRVHQIIELLNRRRRHYFSSQLVNLSLRYWLLLRHHPRYSDLHRHQHRFAYRLQYRFTNCTKSTHLMTLISAHPMSLTNYHQSPNSMLLHVFSANVIAMWWWDTMYLVEDPMLAEFSLPDFEWRSPRICNENLLPQIFRIWHSHIKTNKLDHNIPRH